LNRIALHRNPSWHSGEGLRATEDPELSRTAESDLFIIEVFPTLALPALDVKFYGRFKAPKYNPAHRGKFRQCDWIDVIETVARYARAVPIEGIEVWTRDIRRETTEIRAPCKADQDWLDAVLCGLIGYHWRAKPRQDSIMIGDLTRGYMIAPSDANTGGRLKVAAAKRGVPVDGII
jgi:predicted RNase H-like nuclease